MNFTTLLLDRFSEVRPALAAGKQDKGGLKINASRNHCFCFRFLFLFLVLINASYCQTNLDSLFTALTKADFETKKALISRIEVELNNYDNNYAKLQTEKLMRITNEYRNKWLYIQALIYYSKFGSTEERLNVLNEAYGLAVKQDDYNLPGSVMVNKSQVFIDNMQYDSAMTAILKAKSFFKMAGNIDEEVTVIHIIGDLYYNAGLFDKAEEYYKMALKLKGEPAAWRDWRKFVIINNLGLIETTRGNYHKALDYFNNSLDYLFSLKKNNFNLNDSLRLAYDYYQLAQTYFGIKDFRNAQSYYSQSLSLYLTLKRQKGVLALYLLKGRLLSVQSEYDSSLYYLNTALKMNKIYGTNELGVEIYQSLADAYFKNKDFKNASIYYKKYSAQRDSLQTAVHLAAIMQIYADDNYTIEKTKFEDASRTNKFLTGLIIIISGSLAIIGFILLKLRRSYFKLISKNVELARSEKKRLSLVPEKDLKPESALPPQPASPPRLVGRQVRPGDEASYVLLPGQEKIPTGKKETIVENISVSPEESSKHKELQIQDLISRLERFMNNSRLYLSSELTLETLADKLNTNRTYLSWAINTAYNVNFMTYINELRVKEAVRLFTEGEHETLTIEAIAGKVGFNNRTSFNSAFLKFIGITPSFFIRNLKQVQSQRKYLS